MTDDNSEFDRSVEKEETHFCDLCRVVRPDEEFSGSREEVSNHLKEVHNIPEGRLNGYIETEPEDESPMANEPEYDHVDLTCRNCGASEEYVIPVWQDKSDYSEEKMPDYVGCESCGSMEKYNNDPLHDVVKVETTIVDTVQKATHTADIPGNVRLEEVEVTNEKLANVTLHIRPM